MAEPGRLSGGRRAFLLCRRPIRSTNPIGTGPYIPQEVSVGQKAVLVRAPNHTWWGGTAPLDEIHYIDFGTDPSAMVQLAGSDEIDANYESTGDFIEQLDGLGWQKLEAVTASTIVVRMNSATPTFTRTRPSGLAIQLAVDPKVVLELGYNNLGTTGENHHVCPIHPEYAPLPAQVIDPAGLMPALEAAGMADTEFEVISLDDGLEAATTAAVAAQLKDAGIEHQAHGDAGLDLLERLAEIPVLVDDLEPPPAGGAEHVRWPTPRPGRGTKPPWRTPSSTPLMAKALSLADADERREVDGDAGARSCRTKATSSSPTGARCSATPTKGVGIDDAPVVRASPLQVVDGLIWPS